MSFNASWRSFIVRISEQRWQRLPYMQNIRQRTLPVEIDHHPRNQQGNKTKTMQKRILGWASAMAFAAGMVTAQESQFFIQLEARSTLGGAQSGAQQYSSQLDNVMGFFLGSGWYGIALGPFDSAETAGSELRRLRLLGSNIPSDAYVQEGQSYGRAFWPVGAALAGQQLDPVSTLPSVAPTQEAVPITTQLVPIRPVPEPVPELQLEETPRQAQRSEALLSRDDRKDLQIALKWAGFYKSGIDGAFGRGTRRSMAAWQTDNGFQPSGILTTNQRAVLLEQYNAVLDGMDLTSYPDARAGIQMDVPLGAVHFAKYEAPFAIFEPTGTVPEALVLYISQSGDAKTLAGLYEIMQTLEIVPSEGERSRRTNNFVLTGENAQITSYTEASLRNGEIKGFTLVWPAGDEERRTRILDEMKSSFSRLDNVLDPASVSAGGQSVDLVSGMRIRHPIRNGSGFFVDANGHVMTSSSLVHSCGRVTLNGAFDTRVVGEASPGVALLAPSGALAPNEIAGFSSSEPRLNSEIATAGFSYGGALSAATLNFGTIQDLSGLSGEPDLARLAVVVEEGDAGGPVLDTAGGVIGMLLPGLQSGPRRLPDGVSFTAKTDVLTGLLSREGIRVHTIQGGGALAPEDLTRLAAGMTVLVSCWE